jgi:hypothetical protein
MGLVYGFSAAAALGIIAQRTEDEHPDLEAKEAAVHHAIGTAIAAADARSLTT